MDVGDAVVYFAFWAFDGRRNGPMTAKVLTVERTRQIHLDLELKMLPVLYLKGEQTL